MAEARKEHELSAGAKVELYALGEEWKAKTISDAEYKWRGKEIVRDDKARCRKSCCKQRK